MRPHAFRPGLFRVTFNEALMTLRRNRSRQRENSLDRGSGDAGRRGAAEVQDRRVNNERQHMNRELPAKAMNRLNPALRNAFLLHKGEGWTHQEVAEELGVSQATVKTRFFRVRRQLQQELAVLTR
jgi:RNA polymerase sigma factor (sigma-70 family)